MSKSKLKEDDKFRKKDKFNKKGKNKNRIRLQSLKKWNNLKHRFIKLPKQIKDFYIH